MSRAEAPNFSDWRNIPLFLLLLCSLPTLNLTIKVTLFEMLLVYLLVSLKKLALPRIGEVFTKDQETVRTEMKANGQQL